MLVNDSYNHKEVNRKIIQAVGTPYGLIERLKMKGIGSPRLIIVESSPQIEQLLNLDSNANWCFVEMRPEGIILRFRSILETYALVIPYWKLVIYKTDASIYTIHKDEFFVRVKVSSSSEHKFIQRISQVKAEKSVGMDVQDAY
jgi:hypothetical protein